MSMGGQLGHWARLAWWRLRRPKTRGARVVLVREDGRICLVRHTYGSGWYLPGGGLRRTEAPQDGLRREVREELGIPLGELNLLGTYAASAEGKRDTVWVFSAETNAEVSPGGPEIAGADWFRPEGLPEATSPATRRRIQEWAGTRQPSGLW